MSKSIRGKTKSGGNRKPRRNVVNVDLGDVQGQQLVELQDELRQRDGMLVTRSDLVRRCVAYAWRHARLKAWGPP
jgi:hypothetical protein